MSRCPYCRRELPAFETLCQECLEVGYDRIAHPTPWWHRMRLTRDSLYAFLFVFVYVYALAGINRDYHPTMISLSLLALGFAAGLILISIAMRDSSEPKVARRSLYAFCAFLFLFLRFFLRLWTVSSYHPIPNPALWAFVFAVVAAIVESFRADPGRIQARKKGAGGSGA